MSEMQYSRAARQLEVSMADDPYRVRVTEEMQQLKEYINAVHNDPEATASMRLEATDKMIERIALLNQACPYIGQQVSITGEVVEAYFDNSVGAYEMDDKPYNNRPVIAAGYGSLGRVLDGDIFEVQVGHLFYLGQEPTVTHDDIPLVRVTSTLHAFAPIDDGVDGITINTYGYETEWDEAQIKREIPELYKEFHGRIPDANDGDECAALYSLVNMRIHEGYDVPRGTWQRFESYAFGKLGFDRVMPYRMTVRGLVSQVPGGDVEAAAPYDFGDSTELLVMPEALVLAKMKLRGADGDVTNTRDRCWNLIVRALGEEPGDDGDLYVVPLPRTLGIQPLRSEMHQVAVADEMEEVSGIDEDYVI